MMLIIRITIFQLLQQSNFRSSLHQEWLLAFDNLYSHLFISLQIYSLDHLTKRSLPYPFDEFVSILNNFIWSKDVIVIVVVPATVLCPASSLLLSGLLCGCLGFACLFSCFSFFVVCL